MSSLWVDENRYPKNYNDFPGDFTEDLVDWMNKLQQAYDVSFKEDKVYNGLRRTISDYTKGLRKQMEAIIEAMSVCGVQLERNWPGHRDGKWFLATYNDALLFNEFNYQMKEDDR